MYCHDTDAGPAFHEARRRLFAVNQWQSLNPSLHTGFRHYDAHGEPVERKPRPGDCIRIDLPGPGSPSGGGYDWVSVTALTEEEGDFPFASMTLAPCPDPRSGEKEVAHFYARGATNTLVVRRIGNCVQAEVHGRNEVPNNHEPALLDRLRNEAVALAGKVGLGKIQWADWAHGLVSVVEADAEG